MPIKGQTELKGINLKTHLSILMGTELGKGRPEPLVVVRFRVRGRRWGTAYRNRNLVYIYVRPCHKWYHLIDVLAHEVAHLWSRGGHGKEWKKTFKDLVFQAYGFNIKPRSFAGEKPGTLEYYLKNEVKVA